MSRLVDLTGRRFGRLRVVSVADRNKHGHWVWSCLCDCGEKFAAVGNNLKSGNTQSCGCLRKDVTGEQFSTHKKSCSPEYEAWRGMKARCHRKTFRNYSEWGGRGIKVCDRWIGSFERFLSDMGEKPSNKHSLDRIDNEKGYSPDNCRWATRKEQASNTRRTRLIRHGGVTATLSEWSRRTGIKEATLRARLGYLGWSVERALNEATHP